MQNFETIQSPLAERNSSLKIPDINEFSDNESKGIRAEDAFEFMKNGNPNLYDLITGIRENSDLNLKELNKYTENNNKYTDFIIGVGLTYDNIAIKLKGKVPALSVFDIEKIKNSSTFKGIKEYFNSMSTESNSINSIKETIKTKNSVTYDTIDNSLESEEEKIGALLVFAILKTTESRN